MEKPMEKVAMCKNQTKASSGKMLPKLFTTTKTKCCQTSLCWTLTHSNDKKNTSHSSNNISMTSRKARQKIDFIKERTYKLTINVQYLKMDIEEAFGFN